MKRVAQKQRRLSFFIIFSIFIRHRSLLSIYIYKSRSRQFLEFHLCSFISFFHWFQFICVIYIYIYICSRIFENIPQNGPEYSHRKLAIASFLVTAVRKNKGSLLSWLVSLSGSVPELTRHGLERGLHVNP